MSGAGWDMGEHYGTIGPAINVQMRHPSTLSILQGEQICITPEDGWRDGGSDSEYEGVRRGWPAADG